MGDESDEWPLDGDDNNKMVESETVSPVRGDATEGTLSRPSSVDSAGAGTDDSSAAAVQITRNTEEEDLDYDDDSHQQKPTDDCEGAISDDNDDDAAVVKAADKEEGEESSDSKEEGELEDGELTDSDAEAEPAAPKPNVGQSALPNRSRPRDWSPPLSNKPSFRQREKAIVTSGPTSSAKDEKPKVVESAWERGLREAREAMRRANKVREEPDFESKRLLAAPSSDRGRGRDTDSDGTPRCSSRSLTPQRGIPSLLELRMSPPRNMRNPPKELGPQVIYPNGRPNNARRGDRDNQRRPTRRDTPPGPPQRMDSPPRYGRAAVNRRDSPRYQDHPSAMQREPVRMVVESTTRVLPRGATLGLSPARDASPISSDSDVELGSSQKKTTPPPPVSRKSGGAMDDVNDPWARKKRPASHVVAEKAKERVENSRSFSRSNSSRSSSSSSTDTSSRKARRASKRRRTRSSSSSSSNSSQSRSRESPARKSEANTSLRSPRSPPRGDISSFRIPKKRSQAGREMTQPTGGNGYSRDRRSGGGTREQPAPSARNPVDEFFSKKPDETPAAFRRTKETSSRRRRSRSRSASSSSSSSDTAAGSGKKRRGLSPSKDAQQISDSDDSDGSKSRSGASSSASSRSGSASASRSASPALPARYRISSSNADDVKEKEESRQRSVSPASDDDVHRKNRESSDSPAPPPPPPVVLSPSKQSRRRSDSRSSQPSRTEERERARETGRQRRSSRESSSTAADEPRPKKHKANDRDGKLSAKERRRRELMEQLHAVEKELVLKKREAKAMIVENAAAH